MGRLPAVLQIVGPAAAERGGVGVRVPGGNDHSVLIRFDHHASAGESRRNPTGRVRKPARKPVGGFREMHGNVWEWCEDSYQGEASRTHDAVKGHSSDRVLRGFGAPGFTNLSVGLRVARDPS